MRQLHLVLFGTTLAMVFLVMHAASQARDARSRAYDAELNASSASETAEDARSRVEDVEERVDDVESQARLDRIYRGSDEI